MCTDKSPKAFVLSAGIQKLPITWLSVDNFDDRVLCYKPTSINHNLHGCFFVQIPCNRLILMNKWFAGCGNVKLFELHKKTVTYGSRDYKGITFSETKSVNNAVNVNIYLTVYPKKYARGFVVLCFVVGMQSFIMNSHEVFIHIHQGFFTCTGAIVRLPQCQWSKPDGYGKISQCITTTKPSKAKTVCIFLGIYCMYTSVYCCL